MRVISGLYQRSGQQVSLRQFLEQPTVRQLAALLEEQPGQTYLPIPAWPSSPTTPSPTPSSACGCSSSSRGDRWPTTCPSPTGWKVIYR
jgi:hypothetical protein